MTALTGLQAYEALERVVERHGADTLYVQRDPQYSVSLNCRNIDEDTLKGLCIVGCVLVEELGISPQRFIEKHSVGSGLGGVCYYIPEVGDLVPSGSDAFHVLHAAQTTQDTNKSWGTALAEAKKVLDSQVVAA